MERREEANLDLLDRVFNSALEGKRVRAYIRADEKVLNPFSVLDITFEVDGQVLGSAQTLLKCDVIGSCKYCFTRDYSHIVLIKNRIEKTLDTKWVNVLTWNGVPIFEDDYYAKIVIKPEYIACFHQKEDVERLVVYRYNSISVERKGSLAMVMVLEKDRVIRYFTENLEVGL
ncbi:MAG: hypothetical protein GU346_06355 [Thermocrinis sp.]|jgi:hypothetical protein|nr:hypothetical protein [Thermocrinis sp.]